MRAAAAHPGSAYGPYTFTGCVLTWHVQHPPDAAVFWITEYVFRCGVIASVAAKLALPSGLRLSVNARTYCCGSVLKFIQLRSLPYTRISPFGLTMFGASKKIPWNACPDVVQPWSTATPFTLRSLPP